MRRAAALLVLASSLVSCGEGDPVALSVEMSLDAASCTVGDPDALQLDCPATAGVWLRGGDGDVLDQACVDFGGAAGSNTLADLSPLLAGIDLSTASTGDVWIEVAVYAPWSASAGCPVPEALPGDGERVIVSGSSARVPLSESAGSLEVTLSCELAPSEPPGGEPDPACQRDCADEVQDCLDEIGVEDCEEEEDDCLDDCDPGDMACEAVCTGEFLTCLSGTPDGICAIQLIDCEEGCKGDAACIAECDADYPTCVGEACDARFEECSDACEDAPDGGGDGCVSVAP